MPGCLPIWPHLYFPSVMLHNKVGSRTENPYQLFPYLLRERLGHGIMRYCGSINLLPPLFCALKPGSVLVLLFGPSCCFCTAAPKPPLSAVESNYMSRPSAVASRRWRLAGWLSGARLSAGDLGWQWSMNRINNVRFMQQPERGPSVRPSVFFLFRKVCSLGTTEGGREGSNAW